MRNAMLSAILLLVAPFLSETAIGQDGSAPVAVTPSAPGTLPADDEASGLIPGEDHLLRRLELRKARVTDALRLIAEISGLNVVATAEASDREVSLLMQNITAAQGVEILCKVAGLWYLRDEDTRTFRVMTTEEYQKDHIVYRKDEIRTFTLKFPNAIAVAVAIEDLFGGRVYMSLGMDEEQIDSMSGLDEAQNASGTGTGSGGYDYGGGYGSGSSSYLYGNSGRYSRSGYGGSGRFSRQGGYGYGSGQGGGTRQAVKSESMVDETFTSEQLAQLEKRLAGRLEAEADELAGLTRKDPPIYVTVVRQHNIVMVRTSDGEAMKDIERLIEDIDRPTPQVLLEMKILDLSVGDSFRSVFDFEVFSGGSTQGTPSSQPANPLDTGAATSPGHALGSGNFPLEGGTLVYQFLNDKVRARIQLLASDGRVEVVSTPVLLASNNRPARMFVGEERVLTTGVNSEVVTPDTGPSTVYVEAVTEVRDVGNTLIIVPKINADRTVTLYISQDSSTVNPDAASIPIADAAGITDFPIDTVSTATLQATVVAKDGMTLAIGGLITMEQVELRDKVPLLGDIPLLGWLFQRNEISNQKSELLLLITPRVLFTPAEAQEASKDRLEKLSRHRYFKGFEENMEKRFDEVDRKLERNR